MWRLGGFATFLGLALVSPAGAFDLNIVLINSPIDAMQYQVGIDNNSAIESGLSRQLSYTKNGEIVVFRFFKRNPGEGLDDTLRELHDSQAATIAIVHYSTFEMGTVQCVPNQFDSYCNIQFFSLVRRLLEIPSKIIIYSRIDDLCSFHKQSFVELFREQMSNWRGNVALLAMNNSTFNQENIKETIFNTVRHFTSRDEYHLPNFARQVCVLN